MSQGIRHNEGKPQWSQIDFKSLEPMVRVLEAGEKIVGKSNWKKGLLILEVCESLLRHTFAYMDGEDNDQKSGQPHVGHIMANAMFLSHMHLFRPDMDNREKGESMNENRSKSDFDAEMLKLHGLTYEEWCSRTEGMSDDEKNMTLMSSIPNFWALQNRESRKFVPEALVMGGVLDESNFRQVAEDFANRWKNYKEEPPRILTPMQARFDKAFQNAKVGARYPKEKDHLEEHYQKTVFRRDPVTEM